ncbi:hypothetical protein [Celerinatantimonas sp. MCCC 1A17872]|uniref:hypothetical protein n=1 Tax=Celerinatantimonas sp. MCCC 1A17872 TaxID=3177514 RepID=UPI0038BEE2E0
MNIDKDFILEPIVFSETQGFLCGSDKVVNDYQITTDRNFALQLFFEQNLPEQYAVWSDFITDISQHIFDSSKYRESKDFIKNQMRSNSSGINKDAIKKRRLYLNFKKNKEKQYVELIDFLNEIGSECVYNLELVSSQRYIFDYDNNSIIEEVFEIFKQGMMPCGYNKKINKIVVYNPIELRLLYKKYEELGIF